MRISCKNRWVSHPTCAARNMLTEVKLVNSSCFDMQLDFPWAEFSSRSQRFPTICFLPAWNRFWIHLGHSFDTLVWLWGASLRGPRGRALSARLDRDQSQSQRISEVAGPELQGAHFPRKWSRMSVNSQLKRGLYFDIF